MNNDVIFISIILLLLSYIFYSKKRSCKRTPFNGKIVVCLVINKTLHMTVGKIVAQIGHALFNVVGTFHKREDLFEAWEANGRKMDFYGSTIGGIKGLAAVLHKYNIPYSKIVDAGRTQIPSGSNTVLIVGPGDENDIYPLMSHLDNYLDK